MADHQPYFRYLVLLTVIIEYNHMFFVKISLFHYIMYKQTVETDVQSIL